MLLPDFGFAPNSGVRAIRNWFRAEFVKHWVNFFFTTITLHHFHPRPARGSLKLVRKRLSFRTPEYWRTWKNCPKTVEKRKAMKTHHNLNGKSDGQTSWMICSIIFVLQLLSRRFFTYVFIPGKRTGSGAWVAAGCVTTKTSCFSFRLPSKQNANTTLARMYETFDCLKMHPELRSV